MTERDYITTHIKRKYKAQPEHLWIKYPNIAVFRHNTNSKWFAIMMNAPRTTMRVTGDGNVDIINVKCASEIMGALLSSTGYRPAYHMNKAHWISIILDGTVSHEEILHLIEQSYNLTAGK